VGRRLARRRLAVPPAPAGAPVAIGSPVSALPWATIAPGAIGAATHSPRAGPVFAGHRVWTAVWGMGAAPYRPVGAAGGRMERRERWADGSGPRSGRPTVVSAFTP